MRIISGKARGRTIDAPKGMDTRPTLDRVRESLFNILQRVVFDAEVLDLFSGSGALAFEAISRGARRAVLCDVAREPHSIQVKNAQKLGFEQQCEFMLCDWKHAVAKLYAEGDRFDLIFLDPPYRFQDLTEITQAVCTLLKPDGLVIIEHDSSVAPDVTDLLTLTDQRKYGTAGIRIYVRETEEKDV